MQAMGTYRALAVIAIAALGAACGGSNPGSGSKTLYVQALAESDGSAGGTSIDVEVRDGSSQGLVVGDATVTVTGDSTGNLPLSWDGNSRYSGGGFDWDTGWSIDVKRGDDVLQAYLQAPGITIITNPISATTFTRADGNPLIVKWQDEGHRAEAVRIELNDSNFRRDLSNDPLELAIPVNSLVPTGNERVEVNRSTEVNLEGGTPGSLFRATTRHRIEFIVQ